MGYIPAGQRVRLIKMEALRNTGTHPLPKKHLNMLPIPRWKLYQTRRHGGAPAQLMQKIYEVDPLICPQCGHEMKVIAAYHRSSRGTNDSGMPEAKQSSTLRYGCTEGLLILSFPYTSIKNLYS
jgi:hypothetical protein